MSKHKKILLIAISTLIILVISGFIWKKTASVTRIALVNFQPFEISNLALSNTDKFIKYEEVSLDDIDKLKNYDFILGFGMGLKMNDEQRSKIKALAEKGKPVYFFAVTNPENKINSLDSLQLKNVSDYLENGNKQNYQNFAYYVRKNIDKKTFFAKSPQSPVENQKDVYFHLDEKVAFSNVADYENYLKKQNLYKPNAPKIAIISGIHDPFSGNKAHLDSLIISLQNKGMNVYPISSFKKRIDFLSQIQPDAVVYFPHGRLIMGDIGQTVEWLKNKNIPLFAPITVLQLKEDWLKNTMGMFGGFMGQCMVMPELDGSIYPYVIVTEEKNKEGFYTFQTLPDRLKDFTQIIQNFISLKKKKNQDKKVAIYYFKGAGKQALTAQGLETSASLYNFLKRLKQEGYKVENLPDTEKEFEKILHTQGAIFNTYAKGAFDEFLQNGNPALVESSKYDSWLKQTLSTESYQEVIKTYGPAPGIFMSLSKDGNSYLAVARIQFGNIVLLPQPTAALGNDEFAIVHGAKMPPPHTYIGSYLWMQKEFKADALIHFGTHGSLEFTPQKQVALSENDWADRLVGTVPHFYYYTIGNIGESMMAKRRSYATIISYLTPAFIESNTRTQFRNLQEKIRYYLKTEDSHKKEASLAVKKIAVEMGLHRDLRLDSLLINPYTLEEIERIENFAEEISNEKMNGQLYTTGEAYTAEKIHSTVLAMSADPVAYSLASLDKQKGKVTDIQLKNKVFFSEKYLNPAKNLINQILNGKPVTSNFICSVAGVSMEDLEKSKKILSPPKMQRPVNSAPKGKPSGNKPHGNTPPMPSFTKQEKEKALAILEIERTLTNVLTYKKSLEDSPELELKSMLNALSGGYVAPSSGGDAVANPRAVPTGHNLYSINAESTPSELAWDRGVSLAQNTLDSYKKQHGKYPQKVCYTFWSSEFIESEGVTIAQAMYMLGVEPVRDTYGRVSDVRLIPSKTLGRPRIDIIVQTSGQFRDLAASRLILLSKAIELASSDKEDNFENLVSKSTVNIEKELVEQGVPPKEAREMSKQRIFGGIQGRYDTGIKDMITAGDKWESEKEIADTYINNMGAVYGSDKDWGNFKSGLLRAALQNTDIIIQPRQNNTWGALSLDHVYEFMGGMNLAIRNVTGKDPDAYLADYRNHNNMKMQELKEAIGIEARTTIFNPTYIKEVMKGKATSAEQITEVITNTYGWNVTRPEVIDKEMWDQIYDTYVKDKNNLGIHDFFRRENPAALQEISAVMLETARKGMWKASEDQLKQTAELHTQLVKDFGAEPSGFSGNNAKLQDFIAGKVSVSEAKEYKEQIQSMKSGNSFSEKTKDGKVLKKEEVVNPKEVNKTSLNKLAVAIIVVIIFGGLLVFLRRKRKNNS